MDFSIRFRMNVWSHPLEKLRDAIFDTNCNDQLQKYDREVNMTQHPFAKIRVGYPTGRPLLMFTQANTL